jgi:hypothetical protein
MRPVEPIPAADGDAPGRNRGQLSSLAYSCGLRPKMLGREMATARVAGRVCPARRRPTPGGGLASFVRNLKEGAPDASVGRPVVGTLGR